MSSLFTPKELPPDSSWWCEPDRAQWTRLQEIAQNRMNQATKTISPDRVEPITESPTAKTQDAG
jgi:hypothetical protein